MNVTSTDKDSARLAEIKDRNSVELFWDTKGRGALVYEPGTIDWDRADDAFRQLLGIKDPFGLERVTLHHDEWIGGVAYTWGLAGSAGAWFRTYQLPGVSNEEVLEAHLKLKRDRDVVGRIPNVRILELVDFDCPTKTPKV